MAAVGDDAVLVKIAVFGIVMSVMCTTLFAVLLIDNGGDYDYDEITAYRNDLISFSGQSMINETPWILSHVYTPWNESYDAETHTDDDLWLYGEEITDYPDLNKSADIKLDPDQKSSTLLDYRDTPYETLTGYKWWSPDAGNENIAGMIVRPFARLYTAVTDDEGKIYGDVPAHSWNYTGYRYVFDPTLPFNTEEAGPADGSLSIVWYSYSTGGGTQEGLSGGLVIYNGSILIANYSATDIVADYNTTSGFATIYDFDFGGTVLTLSIRFDQNALQQGMSLMEAWTAGYWSMAISSPAAGSFFDIDGSSSFTVTAGNMISTFIKIYTFDMPEIENQWAQFVIWALVGLPMTMAMLLITLRLINGFRVI